MSFRRLVIVVLVGILVALASPLSAQADQQAKGTGAACGMPASDMKAIDILNNHYPGGYWWDHTDLTIAVQGHPKATPEQLDAIEGAIATWSTVLENCFDGRITLTDVTGSKRQQADIVVHYVPTAGGVRWAGFSHCGGQGCSNVMVRSDFPPSRGADPLSPEYLGLVTLHEIGHALGIGHPTDPVPTTDLMGGGFLLSQCDVDAIAFVFAWALDGVEPHRPGPGPYVC